MKRTFLLANIIFAVVLVGAIAAQSMVDRRQTLEEGFQTAESLSQALAQHTEQVADTLAVGLGTLTEQFALLTFNGFTDRQRLHELLATRQANSPLTYSYYVLDVDGRVLAVSGIEDPIPTDMSWLPAFEAASSDVVGDGLVLGTPRVGTAGYAEGRRIVTVSQRLEDADGEFAGVVAANVSLDYLLEFYRSLRPDPDDVVGMVDSDGVLIARSPAADYIGTVVSDDLSIVDGSAPESDGRFLGRVRGSGEPDRLYAFRSVPTRALTVFVGLDRRKVLAPWVGRLQFKILVGLLAIGLFATASMLGRRLLRIREEALALEAARKREVETVFRSISDAVSVLDRNCRFTYVNDESLRILDRSRESLLGSTLWEAFPDLVGTEAWSRIQQSLETGESASFSLYFEPIAAHLDIRLYPHEDGLTIYFRDITARLETEERLRQAQKMEAVGQLTGGVAHDFNNLLTVIQGNAESLLEAIDEKPDGDSARDRYRLHADLIRQAGARATELTHRLLAFARRQPLDPRLTDINQLVGETEDLLRRTIREDLEIELVRGSGLWKTLVDPHELQNALLNLAINARDSMPDGGKLTIETANMSVDMDYADIHGIEAGQYVTLAVSDTGTGMDAEIIEKAFDPFFTTKREGKGSGLGLSMVYGFARQSGGHVKIYSEPGQGTAVRLYLPRATDDSVAEAPAAPRRNARELPTGDEHVLVVEDDGMVRQYTVSSLERLGYSVVACADAAAALQQLQEAGPFDLLLTDVVLAGGMSGRELADRAVDNWPGLKVLYMSGYTENAILHHGRLDRGVHLLNKPFRLIHLARKLREVLDAR